MDTANRQSQAQAAATSGERRGVCQQALLHVSLCLSTQAHSAVPTASGPARCTLLIVSLIERPSNSKEALLGRSWTEREAENHPQQHCQLAILSPCLPWPVPAHVTSLLPRGGERQAEGVLPDRAGQAVLSARR